MELFIYKDLQCNTTVDVEKWFMKLDSNLSKPVVSFYSQGMFVLTVC